MIKVSNLIPKKIRKSFLEHDLRSCEGKLQYHQMMVEHFRLRIEDINDALDELRR